MFGKAKSTPLVIEQETFSTLIAKETRIEGTMLVESGVRIDGELKGGVHAHGDQEVTVVISASGHVEGDVRAHKVVIAGRVSGQIHALDRVELHAGCLVQGDIKYGSIAIEHGARVLGLLLQTDGSEDESVEENAKEAIQRAKKEKTR